MTRWPDAVPRRGHAASRCAVTPQLHLGHRGADERRGAHLHVAKARGLPG